jgi:hypothetical protein
MHYPTWLKAQAFFGEVCHKHMAGRSILDFTVISAIIREIVDTFGKFHGKQCQGLKQSLSGLERKTSEGCVALPDFYEKGLKGDSNWLFVETPEYLRRIGVLDETEPKNPRLLSANYINSPTNCLQPSGYYMVCCHNECDDILGGLEAQLAKPSGTPTEIINALVKAGLTAPWMLAGGVAPAIRFRLDQIAEYDGGAVPIHGRLFAQWLHHVYPRECPYPHLAGTTQPQWITDFEEETGTVVQMTDEAMISVVHNASNTVAPQPKVRSELSATFGSCAPWQDAEELFAPLPTSIPLHELENDPHVWNVFGLVAFLGAVSTFTITLVRTFKTFSRFKPSAKMMYV